MRRLRSTWIQRGLALLLVSSLLPVAFMRPAQGVHRSVTTSHADWLRSQVRMQMNDAERTAFEAALQAAIEAEPQALRAFLQHFTATYAKQEGRLALTALLGLSSSAPLHIASELERRRAQLSGWAVAPRLSAALPGAPASTVPRGSLQAVVVATAPVLAPLRVLGRSPVLRTGGHALAQVLSAARPRAP
jgi:hypothetical protein